MFVLKKQNPNSRLRRQQRFCEVLYRSADVSLADAMRQCSVSPKTVAEWMDESGLQQALHLQFRIKMMEGRSIIGRAVPMAAAKLVELLAEDADDNAGRKSRDETIRKACLDILSLGSAYEQAIDCRNAQHPDQMLSDEEAEKLIAALTQDDDDPDDGENDDKQPLWNRAEEDTEPL